MDDQSQIALEFPDELACMQLIEGLRWPEGASCVRCGGEVTRLASRNASEGRFLYQCRNRLCRYQFGPTTGTLLHDSRVPLQKWLYAVALMLTTEESLTVRDAQRELKVSYKTAWYLCHRIRAALHPERAAASSFLAESDQRIEA